MKLFCLDFLNLIVVDAFLEVIRTNLPASILLSLQSRGEIIAHLSSELLNYLGYGF